MSALAKFHERLTRPRYICKGEMVGFGPKHRYRVFNADGKQLTSFVADPETAVELALRDKLEAVSAAFLRRFL